MGIVMILGGLGLCGFFGSAVAHPDKKGLGFAVGFLLGPIGVMVAAVALKD
jgi:hypothetical protein